MNNFEFYYNNVPGEGLCRNNLIYTSLISNDKKTFCQWYHNDSEYHKGKNQVVDTLLMEEKWLREVKFLTFMKDYAPEHIPKILEIDYKEKKIYLKIDGVDFWQISLDTKSSYETYVPDWQDQMLEIIKFYKVNNLYKFSMHPSSYFIVEGKLKSINYFFVYHEEEGPKRLVDHQSHISTMRQQQMKKIVESKGISWSDPEPLVVLQKLCFDSFATNYPADFIEKAKRIYND